MAYLDTVLNKMVVSLHVLHEFWKELKNPTLVFLIMVFWLFVSYLRVVTSCNPPRYKPTSILNSLVNVITV